MTVGQGRITTGGPEARRRRQGRRWSWRAGTIGGHRLVSESVAQPVPGGQSGSVTAEVAVVLPALVVLIALLLGTAHVGTAQLRLDEAARAGAREAMRGESSTSVEQTVQRLAGTNATTRISAGSGWTTVEVRTRVTGPIVGLMDLQLQATASGREEHR